LKLILGIRSFDFDELGVDFRIRSREAELGGALVNDLIEDEFLENLQSRGVRLIGRGPLLRVAGQLRGVKLVDVRAQNRMAIDGCDNSILLTLVTAGKEDKCGDEKGRSGAVNSKHEGGIFLRCGAMTDRTTLQGPVYRN